MVFGLGNKKIEERLNRLETIILALSEKISGDSEKPKRKSVKDEIFEKLDQLDRAMIEKRLRALERRLKHAFPDIEPETIDYDFEPTQNPNPDIPIDINKLLSNPMLRLAINGFLKSMGTSIEDLKTNPEKLIDILETITTRLKEKKKESEEKKTPFNPYDPTLFMR